MRFVPAALQTLLTDALRAGKAAICTGTFPWSCPVSAGFGNRADIDPAGCPETRRAKLEPGKSLRWRGDGLIFKKKKKQKITTNTVISAFYFMQFDGVSFKLLKTDVT